MTRGGMEVAMGDLAGVRFAARPKKARRKNAALCASDAADGLFAARSSGAHELPFERGHATAQRRVRGLLVTQALGEVERNGQQ